MQQYQLKELNIKSISLEDLLINVHANDRRLLSRYLTSSNHPKTPMPDPRL